MTEQIEGLDELAEKLASMGAKVGGRNLSKAARFATTPLVTAARRRVPQSNEGHRLYTGEWVAPAYTKRKGIKKRVKLSRDKTRVWSDVGVTDKAYYSTQFVERGTSKQPAQPWLVPAFDATKDQVLDRMKSRLKKLVEDAAR